MDGHGRFSRRAPALVVEDEGRELTLAEEALARLCPEDTLWRIARCEPLRMSIADVDRLPAPLLWEAEAMAALYEEAREVAEWNRSLAEAAADARRAAERGR